MLTPLKLVHLLGLRIAGVFDIIYSMLATGMRYE